MSANERQELITKWREIQYQLIEADTRDIVELQEELEYVEQELEDAGVDVFALSLDEFEVNQDDELLADQESGMYKDDENE